MDHHLVGDTFSVADLTAASLLYPIVRPPEAHVQVLRMPARVEELRDELGGHRGYRWVEEMFAVIVVRRDARPAPPDGAEI